MLRGIRDSKKKKKGRGVRVLTIEHYYREEGLAGVTEGEGVKQGQELSG